ETMVAYLDITLSFKGSHKGQTTVRLPKSFAGVGEQYEQIYNLRVDDGYIENTKKPHYKIIHHRPNKKIILRYQVRSKQEKQPYFTHDMRYPLLFKNYMHFISTM